jgi:hypothetical protein
MLITWEGVLGEAAKGATAAGVSDVYAVGHADADAVPFECLQTTSPAGPRLAVR